MDNTDQGAVQGTLSRYVAADASRPSPQEVARRLRESERFERQEHMRLAVQTNAADYEIFNMAEQIAAYINGPSREAEAVSKFTTLPKLPDMRMYVGTKALFAKSMTRGEYNVYRGWTIPENENPDDEGWIVQYADGYISWSPAEVFADTYRLAD